MKERAKTKTADPVADMRDDVIKHREQTLNSLLFLLKSNFFYNLLFKTLYFSLRFEGGRFLYKLHRSPMCEYMINFILKLKHLPEKYMMNSVLENFTILQVIRRNILFTLSYIILLELFCGSKAFN